MPKVVSACAVPLDDHQRAVDGDDGVERRGDELPQPRFRLAQRLFRARAA